MEQSKQILVVCSRLDGNDFNKSLNNNLKILFGLNPNYIFCDGREEDNRFPNCPNGDIKYDFIWFAGCNLIQNVFNGRNVLVALEKIRNSLKPNGYVVFTEVEGYVKRYKPIDYSLTVTIEMINIHSQSDGFFNPEISAFVIEYFRKIFVQINLDHHIVYQIIKEGGNNKKNRIERNNMLDLDTYVNPETHEIINSLYLREFNGGKRSLKRRRSRQTKRESKKTKRSRSN